MFLRGSVGIINGFIEPGKAFIFVILKENILYIDNMCICLKQLGYHLLVATLPKLADVYIIQLIEH